MDSNDSASDMILEHPLRLRQSMGITDLKDTLKTVEINLMNNCNRSCGFCPQSLNIYDVVGFMSIDTVTTISNRLIEYGYKNRISLCGFGEPTLYKQLIDTIAILRRTNGFIELTTNGDLLTAENIAKYFDAGLDMLNVSAYDIETDIKTTTLLANTDPSKYIIRKRYLNNFTLVNRNEILEKNVSYNLNRPCYLPSYKMMIDIDGSVLLCCNDWARTKTFGNIYKNSIETIWIQLLNFDRKKLIQGDRSLAPCNTCNIDGTLYGADSVAMLNSK
jgi:MoaA/NifB/PqqE/SkfB family radical SAM enzyme